MFADRMGLGLRHQELLDMRAGRSPCSRGRAQAVTDHSSEVSAAPHAWTDHHSSNFSKRLCPWIRREGNGIAPSSRRGAPPSPPKPALGRLSWRPLSFGGALRPFLGFVPRKRHGWITRQTGNRSCHATFASLRRMSRTGGLQFSVLVQRHQALFSLGALCC